MAIQQIIQYGNVSDLLLDPKNPRLGRENTKAELAQEAVLKLMDDYTLDELAVSFLESSFWPNEAVIVVREPYHGVQSNVVVEGNRRLAALKLLLDAHDGKPSTRKWQEIAASCTDLNVFNSLRSIPFIVADSREDIQSFLGFRHVTGIKEWEPAEKAEYIADLIDNHSMTYTQVMRKIGSTTPVVRQNYISFRILLQMEENAQISLEKVEERFSLLYLSLRTNGVQQYLQVDIRAEPDQARMPIPTDKLEHLAKFALWLFGKDGKDPVVPESRDVDKFGKVLENPESIEYLETASNPNFETAYRLSGGDLQEIIDSVQRAAFEVEQALSRAHHHSESSELQAVVRRLGKDVAKLVDSFPDIKAELGRASAHA